MKEQSKVHNSEIYIFSINMVAYLKANKIKPLRFEKTKDTNKIVYWFKNTETLQFLLSKYKQDNYLQCFINELRNTRTEIKSIN